MRFITAVLLLTALTACSSQPVRCDQHLVPINPVPKAAAAEKHP